MEFELVAALGILAMNAVALCVISYGIRKAARAIDKGFDDIRISLSKLSEDQVEGARRRHLETTRLTRRLFRDYMWSIQRDDKKEEDGDG